MRYGKSHYFYKDASNFIPLNWTSNHIAYSHGTNGHHNLSEIFLRFCWPHKSLFFLKWSDTLNGSQRQEYCWSQDKGGEQFPIHFLPTGSLCSKLSVLIGQPGRVSCVGNTRSRTKTTCQSLYTWSLKWTGFCKRQNPAWMTISKHYHTDF